MDKSKQTTKKWQNPFSKPANDDLLCGLFGWKPKWLQVCNNMKFFMLCYVCLGVFRGMSSKYFSSVLPSIEKRFGFTSQHVGTVKAMNDVSHLITALIIAHFGGAGHRPRWIAAGTFVVGVGILLQAAPEILFPVTPTSTLSTVLTKGSDAHEQFCVANKSVTYSNQTLDCTEKPSNDHMGPLIVLGVAEFLIGLGGTTTMILGLPFVDDQVKYKNTPLYYALSFSGHIFGPLIGLGLGAVANNIFFDFSKPDFKPIDPRWISAWYLGFIVCGLGTCIFALTMACFPSAIPEAQKRQQKNKKSVSKQDSKAIEAEQAMEANNYKAAPKQIPVTLRDLPRNLKRLLSNTTYLTKLCSQLLNGFVLSGYMSFMQKFLKEQYQLPQSITNLAGGMPPIFTGFLGIVVGGLLVRRFKFKPQQVCFLMAASSIIGAICYFSVITMGCDRPQIVGVDDVADPYDSSASDNLCVNTKDCSCGSFKFSPVCDLSTNVTFMSACVAGCKSSKRVNMVKFYFGCSCAGNHSSHNNMSTRHVGRGSHRDHTASDTSSVISGICPKKCPNFVIYVLVMAIAKFFMGLPTAGMLMVQFRIVDYDLKSLANGVSTIVMSAFGFLPAPILCGMLIDSACALWQKSPCGAQGACWLYNADDFRWKLHVAVGLCRLVTCIMDLIISYKVRNLTFDREADAKRLASSRAAAHPEGLSAIELAPTLPVQDGSLP